jgi:DNA polymerase-1
MGLLFADNAAKGEFSTKSEEAWLQELGCKGCTLNHTPGKIDATGSKNPEIYVLGEAAGAQEEEQRRQFVGKAGQLLRDLMPRQVIPLVRWNNTINCRPPANRNPTPQERSCCKPRVVGDIERAKPKVIWGFGNVPLQWVSGFNGIKYWRGRRMPVKIGSHVCWYYPFYHPSFLGRIARDNGQDFGSEDERVTYLDLLRAFDELDDLPQSEVHTEAQARANVECITDIGQISKALQWAARQPGVGLDYETNRKRPYEEGAKVLSASVGTLERSYAFPIEHPEAGYTPKQVREIEELWRRFLVNAPCRKIVHNLAFEQEWSAYRFGAETLRARPWEDTANAAAIIDERVGDRKDGPFSLNFQVQMYYGFNIKKLSNVDRKKLEFTPLSTVLSYNGIDSKYHYGVWVKQWEIIKQEGLQLPYELAVRRVPTVVLSQIKGVPVNQAVAKKLQKKYKKKVDEALDEIAALPVVKRFERLKGKEFNPLSSKDLPYVLGDLLGCRETTVVDKYSKEEKISTDDSVLNEIIKNYQPSSDASVLAKQMIALREANGTKTKYIDSLIFGEKNCVLYTDGLIHTNFNTYFAETGRLSSDEPNLQNFPKRDAETKEVRKSIEAAKGCGALAFDYGQIEARVIAMFTKDKLFCKALWEKFDVHQDWAERLAYAYPPRIGGKKFLKDKKVLKTFRTDVKNQWTFPLFFGARDASVANYLQIPVEIISREVREFWKMFPASKGWQEETLKFYQEYGYVETLTGRRRHGPMTTNQIYNSPVQGTAAEIVLDAMSRLSEMEDLELQPEINIHDDLTFLRVPLNRMEAVAEKVIDTMLKVPFKFVNVPIAVEMGMGTNWGDIEEIKDDEGKTVSVYYSNEWNKR